MRGLTGKPEKAGILLKCKMIESASDDRNRMAGISNDLADDGG